MNAQLGDPMAVAPTVHVAIAPSMTQLLEQLFLECRYHSEVKSSHDTAAVTIDVGGGDERLHPDRTRRGRRYFRSCFRPLAVLAWRIRIALPTPT